MRVPNIELNVLNSRRNCFCVPFKCYAKTPDGTYVGSRYGSLLPFLILLCFEITRFVFLLSSLLGGNRGLGLEVVKVHT